MLFNSGIFVFAFLPAVLLAVHSCERATGGGAGRNTILLFSSLLFYGYWNIYFLPLLILSILFNFAMSLAIERGRARGLLAAVAVAGNLVCLGIFKYLLFFAGALLGAQNVPPMVRDIVLPIGISFFTFQQIAYVIDVWRQRIKVGDLLSYAVFVTFFPQLIAGPIVRYQEIVPQLYQKLALGRYFAAGIFLFVIGLLKKVVVADNLAQPANSIFDAVERGSGIGFDDAWLGALAYTFQLYFDFSAYSDMALGIGLMLGLRLPVNFDSPYKARSIVEFWRRWHMTLSSFFRDYLYIFLGGNRHGPLRQLGALLVVMGLVGLWHGAGWTFVLWGLYHGVLLMGAHVFAHGRRLVGGAVGWRVHRWHELARIASGMSWVIEWGTTFVLVVLGWVIFRAANLGVAEHMLGAMISPTRAPDTRLLLYEARYVAAWGMIVGSFVICMLLPNAVRIAGVGLSSDSFFHRGNQVRPVGVPVWMRPTEMSYGLVALLAVAFYFACTTMLTTTSEFIYFQF